MDLGKPNASLNKIARSEKTLGVEIMFFHWSLGG